jgi:large subunit ribosomal protein L32e
MGEKYKMKFLRRTSKKLSKLGKKRKKKQVWRRPSGRDNKMREKRKGYPAVVSVGYKKDKKERGKIKGLKPVRINNIKELEKLKKEEVGFVGKIGKKKRNEILKKAKEMKIGLANFNSKKIKKQLEKSGEKKNESK